MLDPALIGLIGVGVGSIISVIGNVATSWLSIAKEREQWNRQQEEKYRDEELKLSQEAEKAMTNAIKRSLGALNAIKVLGYDNSYASDEAKTDKIYNLSQVVSEGVIETISYQKNSDARVKLTRVFNAFLAYPVDDFDNLIRYLTSLFDSVEVLPVEDKKVDEMTFRVYISQKYRESEFERGIFTPYSSEFSIKIVDLNQKHRRMLLEAFPHLINPQNAQVTDLHVLYKADDGSMKHEGLWGADMNPANSSGIDIINKWSEYIDRAKDKVDQA